MAETYPFKPDWCLAPSETLKDWLSENGMNPRVLAASCAGPCTHEIPHTPPSTRTCREGRKQSALALITEVLQRRPLTQAHADCLAHGTFIPSRFWLALETNYRNGLAAGLKDASQDDAPCRPGVACPSCGSANPEHERGLLFCGACGHTWEDGTDDARDHLEPCGYTAAECAAWRESEDAAWGGRGPSASHAEWVAEGQDGTDPAGLEPLTPEQERRREWRASLRPGAVMAEILTPRCPLCGEPPGIVIPGGIQAFCGNDDCTLWYWNPSVSLDENLLDAGVARWEPTEGTGDDGPA